MAQELHKSAYLDPIWNLISSISPPPKVAWDATYGRGGHTELLLKLASVEQIHCSDADPTAIAHAKASITDPRARIHHGYFDETWPTDRPNGPDLIIADLGMSSPQIDEPGRGFSYRSAAPLDLRFNFDLGEPTWQWLAQADVQDLVNILREFGELNDATRISSQLIHKAKLRLADDEQLLTTDALEIAGAPDQASKLFQALRIFENRELPRLVNLLEQIQAWRSIRPPGPEGQITCVWITFHSLEDRAVKRFASQNRWSKLAEIKSGDARYDRRLRSAKLRAYLVA